MSPDLSTNLICVGQFVDNNCDVYFSHSGCVLHDPKFRKMIAKMPKARWLFPLRVSRSPILTSSYLLYFPCNVVSLGNKLWYRCLDHPNSNVLCILFNSGLLRNKVSSCLDFSLDCTACKIGKVQFYIFILMDLMPHNVLVLFIVMLGEDFTYYFSCPL